MKKISSFILVALIITFAFYVYLKSKNPGSGGKIKGKLMDVAYVQDGDNEFIWILTNGTKTYIQETHSPGRHTIEQKGMGEKLWLYKYSLKEDKIIEKKKIRVDFIPQHIKLIQHDKELFLVNIFQNNLCFNVFDKISGDTVCTFEQFQQRFPIMQAGISSLFYKNFSDHDGMSYISIETRDGHTLFYSIPYDTIYTKRIDMSNDYYKRLEGDEILFKLEYEINSGAGKRKILYRLDKYEDTYEMYSVDLGRMITRKSGFIKTESTLLDSGNVFLNGRIVFQDQENVIILHDAGLGDNDEDRQRFFTCYDRKGKRLWKLNLSEKISEELFRTDEATSDIFFMGQDFNISRTGDIFTIAYLKGDGVMYAINRSNGKELYRLEL